MADLVEMLGIPKTSLRRLVDAGSFPQPVRLGPRLIGWRASEVEEWLESRERVAVRP